MAQQDPEMAAPVTTLSSLQIIPNEQEILAGNFFGVPRLTQAQINEIPTENLVQGIIVFNTDYDCYMGFVQGSIPDTPGRWCNFNASITYNGSGYEAGSPFALPLGPRSVVESTPNNMDPGVMYVDSENNDQPRIYIPSTGWQDIAISSGSDTFENITVTGTTTTDTLTVTGNGNINAYTSTLNIDTINAQEINVTNPLNATITTQYLTVNSTATTTNLHAINQIDAGSIAGYITNPPSIAVGPGAGAGASASITGSQISGRFTLTIGTGPVGLELAVISLDASIFADTNFGVCISPAEYNTALDAPLAGIYAVATSSGYPCQFTLYVAPGVPVLNPGSVYTWNYIVIGTQTL